MLARPEIGTKEHIKLWLANKPSDEVFHWPDPTICACGQYEREHPSVGRWQYNRPLQALSSIGGDLWRRRKTGRVSASHPLGVLPTFGELLEAVEKDHRWENISGRGGGVGDFATIRALEA